MNVKADYSIRVKMCHLFFFLPLEDQTQIITEKLPGAYTVSKITFPMKLIKQRMNIRAMNHLRKILASNISIYLKEQDLM